MEAEKTELQHPLYYLVARELLGKVNEAFQATGRSPADVAACFALCAELSKHAASTNVEYAERTERLIAEVLGEMQPLIAAALQGVQRKYGN